MAEYRGKGYEKAIMKELARIAAGRGLGRIMVLSRLESASIDFYLSLGARPMDEWTVYRLPGEALGKLAYWE